MNVKNLLLLTIFFTLTSAYCGTPDEDLIDSIRKADAKNLAQALKAGANPNFADAQGNTVLLMAATFGQAESVKVLLENGADVNSQDQNGNTALMLACRNNRLEILKLLLGKNPDVNLKNKDGETCLAITLRKNLKEISRMLINAATYLDVSTEMTMTMIKNNDEEIYRMVTAKAGAGTNYAVPEAKKMLDTITLERLDLKNMPLTLMSLR